MLLACDDADPTVIADAITALRLDYQVLPDKHALIIVPAGVSKSTGLRTAADALDISLDHTIAVGDADSDLSPLHSAGASITAANSNELERLLSAW